MVGLWRTRQVGDGVMICHERFIITRIRHHSASQEGRIAAVSLDDVPGKSCTKSTVYKYLETQRRPNGDWESWPGTIIQAGMRATYMECSNQGLCNRQSGVCECFDGFEGSGCQRQRCPHDCSGHGLCRSVAQLTQIEPVKLETMCTTSYESAQIECTGPADGVHIGDYVKLGDEEPRRVVSFGQNSTVLDVAVPFYESHGAWHKPVSNDEVQAVGQTQVNGMRVRSALYWT